MRDIYIRPILNGFIVKVGCHELVSRSIEEVTNEIIRYQKNPEAVEKEYIEKAVNKGALAVPTAGPTRVQGGSISSAAVARYAQEEATGLNRLGRG